MKIFGTNYKVKILKRPNDSMKIGNCQGYCDFSKKEIYVLDNEERDSTLLHELIHAHYFESGNESYANDEQLVEVTTNIFEKIQKL